jgi:hypothetical protein
MRIDSINNFEKLIKFQFLTNKNSLKISNRMKDFVRIYYSHHSTSNQIQK